VQVTAFQQQFPQTYRSVVGIAQKGVFNDHASTTASLEHLDEMLQKQKCSFPSLNGKVLLNFLPLFAPKWWIGKNHLESVFVLYVKAHNVTVGGSNPEQDFNAYWMGGDYKFSPAFDLAAAYYNIDTRNQTDVGKNYVTHAYSILADYTWNKYFDSYAGAMLLRYSGEGLNKYAPGTSIYSSNAMYGVGLRFRF
jgi:hypothetical protein